MSPSSFSSFATRLMTFLSCLRAYSAVSVWWSRHTHSGSTHSSVLDGLLPPFFGHVLERLEVLFAVLHVRPRQL